MANNPKSKRAASSSASKRTRTPDAIALLKADHREVKDMHAHFEKLAEEGAAASEREALARRICAALRVHARIEEEIFYPAVKPVIDDDLLLPEAKVEHDSARDLIEQNESSSPKDELFDARVIVLGEYVQHHVKEEEREMFREVRASKELDLRALGKQMQARKEELMAGFKESADKKEKETAE